MNRENYSEAQGFIVTYKSLNEPLLFNELNGRCPGLKLLDRGEDSAAFTVPDYAAVVSEIRREDFIFLQHIHPFMCKCEITGSASDFSEFAKMLEGIRPYVAKEDTLTCQCRIAARRMMEYSNGELTNLLTSLLEKENYTVSLQDADTAVSLTIFDHFAYLGISCLADNCSDRAGGVLFYSKTDDIICRAEFKIEEAFKVFDVNVTKGMKALDLGAAPGGWTHYLSKRGIFVDAVDPAELNESVVRRENVAHYKMTAQEFAEKYVENAYDIIVNDMKMDTNESIDILCDMSRHLKTNGICLLTLKLPKQGVQKRINVARKVLSSKFEIVRVRQLYYNRSEVTVFVKNKLS
ncbi:MAG: hypothetical protein J6B85_11915 [Lachnospiraceae bacterium]|nr:hypothetical protein [Lachnospiraceae bacterium]